ncbi:MAG: DUF1501 domain-containing protein [Planctomycetes bacterium]|nr:DUF1501 domain-containing protein [Planctomycetota bacterium]
MLTLHDGLAAPLCGRREFLRVGGGLAVAGFLSPALAAKAPVPEPRRAAARSCIFIYLLGGPPQLDTFDLKPDAPPEIRGPFKPIATTVPGLRICEHLPRLARLAQRYALVRSVSHNNHNHTPMIYYTLTGRQVERPEADNDVRPPQRTDFPHLGAVLARFKRSPEGLPGYVAIPELAVRSSTRGEFKRTRSLLRGGGGGFLGPLVDPLNVDGEPGTPEAIPALSPPVGVSGDRLERRAALLSVLEHRGRTLPGTRVSGELRQQAVVLSGASGGAARVFSLDGEPERLRERYGQNRFGRALLLARRLAEVGVPMAAIHFNEMTVCDGWDTHSKNFPALEGELLPMIDQGLSALLEDLDARGLLEQTLVVMMGEFGRTPRINPQAGRDHWGLSQSVLLAGGGIQGGRVHGSSDRIAAYPSSDPVDPVDIHATLYHCLGLDPEQTMVDHLRRPFPLSTGRVLTPLLKG